MQTTETKLVAEALVAYRLMLANRMGGLFAVSGAYEAEHPFAAMVIQANYLEDLDTEARADALLGSACWLP